MSRPGQREFQDLLDMRVHEDVAYDRTHGTNYGTWKGAAVRRRRVSH